MILTALFGLVQALLYDLVLFYLGKILSNPGQLRNFLGLNSQDQQTGTYHDTSFWIEKIGKMVMLIAVISAIVSVIVTLKILTPL